MSGRICKKDFQRRVPKLPTRASHEDHCLELPNSLAYLRETLKPGQHHHSGAKAVDPRSLSQIAEKLLQGIFELD
jgi:hypothetical protein